MQNKTTDSKNIGTAHDLFISTKFSYTMNHYQAYLLSRASLCYSRSSYQIRFQGISLHCFCALCSVCGLAMGVTLLLVKPITTPKPIEQAMPIYLELMTIDRVTPAPSPPSEIAQLARPSEPEAQTQTVKQPPATQSLTDPKIPHQTIKQKKPSKTAVKKEPIKSTDKRTQTKQESQPASQNIAPSKRVKPNYPEMARQRQIEGEVILGFTINKQGRAIDITLIKTSPPIIFNEASIQALMESQFPISKDNSGSPTIVTGQQQRYRFKMNGD